MFSTGEPRRVALSWRHRKRHIILPSLVQSEEAGKTHPLPDPTLMLRNSSLTKTSCDDPSMAMTNDGWCIGLASCPGGCDGLDPRPDWSRPRARVRREFLRDGGIYVFGVRCSVLGGGVV